MTTASDYWQQIAATSALRQCRWINSEELLAILSELDVTSHAELIKRFPVLTRQQRIMAIRLFRILEVRSAGPVLITCWLSEDADERWEAKGALEDVQSRRAYRQLLHIIKTNTDSTRCEEACYILAFSFDDILLEPLQKIYAAKDFPPAVRAQAAEGLANLLRYVDRRTKRYYQTLAFFASRSARLFSGSSLLDVLCTGTDARQTSPS